MAIGKEWFPVSTLKFSYVLYIIKKRRDKEKRLSANGIGVGFPKESCIVLAFNNPNRESYQFQPVWIAF